MLTLKQQILNEIIEALHMNCDEIDFHYARDNNRWKNQYRFFIAFLKNFDINGGHLVLESVSPDGLNEKKYRIDYYTPEDENGFSAAYPICYLRKVEGIYNGALVQIKSIQDYRTLASVGDIR